MTMKAYSELTVKSVDEEKRIIRGIASTPTTDRMGDIVVPEGAVIRGEISLHLYHDDKLPVGLVKFNVSRKGIEFEARIPDVMEAGTVRERVNEAWHSVKYRLIRTVSIGFRVIDDAVELLKDGGLKFLKWEMLELSLVSIPAQPDAVIQSFKSLEGDNESERAELIARIQKTASIDKAASGRKSIAVREKSGVSDTPNAGRKPVQLIPRKRGS